MKRILLAVTLAASAAAFPALAQQDPDLKKTAMGLYTEGLRAEGAKPAPNLALALAKYKKARDAAKNEKNTKALALILTQAALCSERLVPENIADAQAAWGEIVSECGSEKEAERAKLKVSWKGVDVWLEQLHASLDAWRTSLARSAQDPAVVEKKEAAWGKIKDLKDDAIPGLVHGLGHRDEVIRDFAADRLAELVHEAGVKSVIEKLNEPDGRAGASTALQKIYKKWSDADAFDQQADRLRRDVKVPADPAGKAAARILILEAEAKKFEDKAAEIRFQIPKNMATPEIQGALEKIIADEAAHPQARREAARAASYIGKISGPLVDALLKGMVSPKSEVREACARAAGAVNTAISADKHKLAEALILAVRYEPAKPASEENKPLVTDDKGTPDWNNDESVRQASAEALEHIALVKSLPALIEALDDNDSRVRGAAFRALREITGRDFAYEKDDKGVDKTYEADKPLAERKKGQAKWKEWWDQTAGVVVLVERFWRFQAEWKDFTMTKLFDREAFLKEIESRRNFVADPAATLARATRVADEFQKLKDVFVQDAVDIGPSALDHLLKFIGGETEREKNPNAATRLFVAEACARIVEKDNGNGVDKIRDKLTGGETAAQKAGGAAGLGFLPKTYAGSSEREVLVKALGAAEVEVKEQAANALGRVGEAANASELAKNASATDTPKPFQIAALRAISRLKAKGVADVIPILTDLCSHEVGAGETSKQSRDWMVREAAADALGNTEDGAAMAALLRARRDTTQEVRDAAAAAIQKVYKAEGDKAGALLLEVLKEEKEKRKTFDRIGAALAIGETGSDKLGKEVADRLIDLNPPRQLRDSDPGVRMALAEALGNLKLKDKGLVGALFTALSDENEAESVRNSAYRALCMIHEKDPANPGSADLKFDGSADKDTRQKAVAAWREIVK